MQMRPKSNPNPLLCSVQNPDTKKSLSGLVAGDGETSLPVQRLLGEGLEVALGVGKAGNHGFQILQDNTLHVAEVAGELQAGDKESSIHLQVGVGVSLSKDNVGSIKRDQGVAVCSSDIVGKLNLNSASGAASRSCRDSKSKGGESEGNGGKHFD